LLLSACFMNRRECPFHVNVALRVACSFRLSWSLHEFCAVT
jgi:hypothetical protein